MNGKLKLWLSLSVMVMMGTSVSAAESGALMSRTQWQQKIGDAAADSSVLQGTLAKVATEDQSDFMGRIYQSIARMPVSPEEKGAKFVQAVLASLRSVKGDQKKAIVAEAFAEIPLTYLPLVTDELSKRFDQKLNKLSDTAYEQIAKGMIETAAKRNAKTAEPSVRDTFVALLFVRGAENKAAAQKSFVAMLPDEHNRKVAADLLPDALNGKYDSLLNSAGIEEEPVMVKFISPLRNPGGSSLDRLLADLDEIRSVEERAASEGKTGGMTIEKSLADVELFRTPFGTSWDLYESDVGHNRVPRLGGGGDRPQGYQNQRMSVVDDLREIRRR